MFHFIYFKAVFYLSKALTNSMMRIYLAGGIMFWHFKSASFINLTGANLSKCVLTGVNMSKCNATQAIFTQAGASV